MTPSEYVIQTRVTDHKDYRSCLDRLNPVHTSVVHYALGLGTEAAEVQDIVKKFLAYGKPIDVMHMKEEMSDICWYLARLCDVLNISFEGLMEMNINKLKVRYGDKFTSEAALNRNLDKEKQALNETNYEPQMALSYNELGD